MRLGKCGWMGLLWVCLGLAIAGPSWGKSYVAQVYYFRDTSPGPIERYVESPLTHNIVVSLTCEKLFGLWGKESSFMVRIVGTWGAGDRAPAVSPDWPVKLGSHRTPKLKCGFMDTFDDYEVKYTGGAMPNFPPDYREGDRFYVAACLDPVSGITVSPRCTPAQPVIPLRPARPDLAVTSEVSPSNSNCGLRIRTRVRNDGDADAHRFRVRIERSRNASWEDQDDQRLHESQEYRVTAGGQLALVYRTPDPIQYTGCRSVSGRQVCDPVRIRACATMSWPVASGQRMGPEIRWEDNLVNNCSLTTTISAPIWSSDHYRRCTEAGLPASGDLIVTADNSAQVYLNGTLLGSMDDWTQASRYNVTLRNGVNVIAIRARDTGGAAGVLAQLTWRGNQTVSGTDWKVSSVLNRSWEYPEFDDAGWERATSYGRYGTTPWGMGVAGFPTKTNAHWMWSSDNQNTDEVFLRYRLVVP